MDRYDTLRARMKDALTDLAILAGDIAGPMSQSGHNSDVSWRDVAGTAAVNLRSLANLLDAIRTGETHHQGYPLTGVITFPSPAEVVEELS